MPGPQNKVITIVGSSCAVSFTKYEKVTDTSGVERIQATATGTATRSDGVVITDSVTWFLGAAAETIQRNFMDNQATMRLREKLGLEAP